MTEVLLWSIPFLIIPISYLFYRLVPLRKIRYSCYAIVFAGAFFLSLFRLSFRSEIIDTGEVMLINFILWESFWFLGRVAKGKLYLVIAVLALSLYGLENQRWITGGPANAWKLWNPVVASTYERAGVRYSVKEKDCFSRSNPARILTLTRTVRFPFVEKQIYAYRTPKGYHETPFTYVWSDTDRGVRLDVNHYNYTLWTMGEGF
ncbi:MAG: hypothetical protein MUF22_01875 [Chitinispirillaceae bacterium]|jgi:hypothetical protein|nr:hypothetical protein [Chitinispirillaceae bacterium]